MKKIELKYKSDSNIIIAPDNIGKVKINMIAVIRIDHENKLYKNTYDIKTNNKKFNDDNNEETPEIINDIKIRLIMTVEITDNGGYKVQPTPIEYSIIIDLKIIIKEI